MQNQLMKDQLESVSLNTNVPQGSTNHLVSNEKKQVRQGSIDVKKYISAKCLIYLVIILIIIILNYLFITVNWMNHGNRNSTRIPIIIPQPVPSRTTLLTDNTPVSRFQKTFWIYTQNQLETQGYSELIYLHHFNDTAHKFGYNAKLVNSWNSYDYLSEQTIAKISKARQNCKVDQPVHNILKLALLMENGGISINQFDIVFRGDSFKWIEDMFQPRKSKQSADPLHFCQPEDSYIYMMNYPEQYFKKKYDSFFIAAVPNSQILREAFNVLINFMETGTFPLNSELNLLRYNEDTNVNYSINSLDDSINHVIYQYLYGNTTGSESKNLCKKYGVQERKDQTIVNMFEFDQKDKQQILKSANLGQFFKTKRNLMNVHIVRGTNNGPMIGILNSLLENHVDHLNKPILEYMPNSILWDILNAPGNKQVFLIPLPPREIQLCLIVFDDQDKQGLTSALGDFTFQQNKNWKQVLFAKDIKNIPKVTDDRIAIVQSSFNEVRNIQIAATKYCNTKGYAVLLHAEEKFNHNKALDVILKAVQPRDTVGAFISLQNSSQLFVGKRIPRFDRRQDMMWKKPSDIPKLQYLLNHFRIISIETFRYIPQFDLRDIYGNYFKERSIFLMNMVQIIKTQLHEPRILYLIKKYGQLWNVPRQSVSIDSATVIMIKKQDEVDRNQLAMTRARLQSQDLHETLYEFLKFKVPFPKLVALNDGEYFVPANKKKGPEIIPKVIHQVWLGTSQLPPAKQYFYRKTQMMYPNYQLKLYRQQNITKQAFPLTYDIIQTIIKFNKNSPYNKLATVTDIIRHQLLYHQGGFWKDAGVNFLRPILDDFTRYKLVITVDKTFRYRWLQGMCFFGHIPQFQNMLRITNFRNINRMNIYNNYASSIAGPIDFRQLLIGQQQYDPQYLTMSYETLYPAQIYQHPQKDLCLKQLSQLKQDDQYQVVQKGWYLLSNCHQLYPRSYGVQHNMYGNTWGARRTLKK